MIRVLRFVLLLAGLGFGAAALAVSDPGEMLADPAREARARALGQELRCLVCQNNSVEESESDFARDMRKVIRARVAAGDDDAAVMAWMTARYGEFVRLNPRLSPLTALLWASPVLALSVGVLVVVAARRRPAVPAAPLTAAEAEAVRLLAEPGDVPGGGGATRGWTRGSGMIWAAAVVLALAALAPALWAMRRDVPERARREAALALHRAQLAELDRDLETGRLDTGAAAAARLEIQRRMLAADADGGPADVPANPMGAGVGMTLVGSRLLWLVVPVVGAAGFALYLAGGAPLLPAQPLAERIAAAERQSAEEDALIAQLRGRLAMMAPDAPRRREGYELLGNAEARRGRPAAAAAAWRVALESGFDPTLAAMTGAAIFQAEGAVTAEAVALFRRALAEAPADAPWRPMAERMLQRPVRP